MSSQGGQKLGYDNWHYVGQPLRILRGDKKTCVELLLNFYFDLVSHIRVSPSQFLLNWRTFWLQWQEMLNNIGIQPRHVLVGPGKHVNIFFEKVCQLTLDISIKQRSNGHFFFVFFRTQVNLF